ncbi:MAG: hypothetical protein SFU87_20595 [Chitinophagaceae bacterium]|nr:hypothetical protein [Chitinophagaceae bacterium]
MSSVRKIDADKIHILSIRTLKGNIDASSEANTDKIASHQFNFELATGLNPTEKVVGLQLLVNINAVDKDDKPLSIRGSYTHEMLFHVDNLDEFIETSESGNVIDAGLGSTLISIIYSTVRGIICTRTQGTSLGLVVLPVIDPRKLMGLAEKEEVKAE